MPGPPSSAFQPEPGHYTYGLLKLKTRGLGWGPYNLNRVCLQGFGVGLLGVQAGRVELYACI